MSAKVPGDGDGMLHGAGRCKFVWREAGLIARLSFVTNYLGGCLCGERNRAGAAVGRAEELVLLCAARVCWQAKIVQDERLPVRESWRCLAGGAAVRRLEVIGVKVWQGARASK